MGVKKSSNFHRPLTEAIEATNEIENKKDKRNGGGVNLDAAAGKVSDPFVRIGKKLDLARAIYGERARAD